MLLVEMGLPGLLFGAARAVASRVSAVRLGESGRDRHGLMGSTDEICLLAAQGATARRNQKDQQTAAFQGRPIVMPRRCRAGESPNELN
jgi:hypothetical protein